MKTTIQKTSKPIKALQALIKLTIIGLVILLAFGYYAENEVCLAISLSLIPLFILAAIVLRWWRWWQHE